MKLFENCSRYVKGPQGRGVSSTFIEMEGFALDRFMEFELEYDGITYEVEAEYSVSDASFDHAFGREVRYDVDVASFKVYNDGYLLIPIDAKFIHEIFKVCDLKAKDVEI